jgi:predicted DsbA family dithiol-disulfide isomerase
MHRWLLEHDQRGLVALRAAAAELGLDVERLRGALREPAVLDVPREDAADGSAAGLTSVPYLLVDGRHVPRWRREGDELLARILDHALEEARAARGK